MSNNRLSQLSDKKAITLSIMLTGLVLLPHSTVAKTYQIQDFSDDYYAVISTIDDEGYESNSIVSIIDSTTK